MKKIILLLLLFSGFLGFAQLNENFDSGMPADWTKFSTLNGTVVTNQTQTWVLNTAPPATYAAHTAPNAAYVNNENIGAGNTEADWLVTDLNAVPTNGQLRFFTRQTITGDQFTKYRIYYSTTSQTDISTFTLLREFTEPELTDLSGDITQYEERSVDFLPAQFGQNVYIAFVRVYTQTTGLRAGDRWLVDDVKMVQKCLNPVTLGVNTIGSTGANLTWGNPSGAATFDIEIIPSTQDPTGVPNYPNIAPTSVNNATNPPTVTYAITGLEPGKEYKYYVRARCTDSPSDFSGPLIFSTVPLGSVCSGPIVVNALPYQTNDNTSGYGDEVDTTQGTQCGANPVGTNYLAGNEVFYSYTPTVSGPVSFTMTPQGTPLSPNSSLFIYAGCTVGTSCVGGMANTGTGVRSVTLNLTAGTTYIVVISSSAATQTVAYNLLIQNEICTPKPTGQPTTNITLDSAQLNWDTTGGYTSWEVAVQPLGAGIPTGSGTYTTQNPYPATGLTAGTQYQYYVRAECAPGSGTFTAWAGPYFFNTQICAESDKCAYTFRMTDTANNGWNGAKMEVRQNGIFVAEIGPTFTAGGGPVNVTVNLCKNTNFTLNWTVAGTQPNQCVVSVINSFGQTIYTKAGGVSGAGQTVYTDVVNCDTPRCDLAPTNITFDNITTTTAQISWVSPGTDAPFNYGYDVYVLPVGSPVPGINDTPTYSDVPSSPFTTTIPLQPDHTYNVYVRVNCASSTPAISAAGTFTTLPTCFKPTNPTVTGITLNSATFAWVPGLPTDTQWEMLVIPSQTPPPAPDNSTPATYTNITTPTFTPTDLTNAQIYYAYVRTYCSATDQSVWVPFAVFNTITCNAADKCAYRFFLTNTAGNNWNGARMEIRQNNILIQTIGASNASINGAPISILLCSNIDVTLNWTVAGTAPDNIGISIQNPFYDEIYRKLPGQGTPGTVLYQTTANCAPPSCPKPTALTAVPNPAASPTSVTLSWTDSVPSPPALYDLYVVPTGGPAPTNNPPTTPTHTNVTNPYTLTEINGVPITPSTSYTYYVRTVCSGTETSTWTLNAPVGPVTFITTPLNDDCSHAIPVTVNPAQICLAANLASGNTYGATASNPVLTPPLAGVGCGATNNDVWYSFVATATSHTISLTNVVATPATAKLNYSVFSGTCGNLTKLYCSTNNTSGATGLVIGQTYYIRVYMATTTANQSATFNLCIIAPPVNDECTTATPVTVSSTQTCDPANIASGNTYGATASSPNVTGTGCGPTNNDVWYSFVATAPSQTITVNDVVPTPSTATIKLNYTVFSGDCANLVKLFCSVNNTSIATGLTIGATYYIRVYTATNVADQSATFHLCITSPPANDECVNAIPVTVNLDQDCTPANTVTGNTLGASASNPVLTPPLTGTGCGPTSNDIWYSFVATATQQTISLSGLTPTPSNATIKLNYSVFSGSCAGLTKLYCSTTNTSNATNLTVGNTYYIRVYTATNVADQSVIFNLCITSPPVNDECTTAIVAPVNPTSVCEDKVYGSTIGATASTPTITGTGCTGTDDDVWFQFTATNPVQFISVSPLIASSSAVSLNHTVFSGSCGALTTMYCSTASTSVATGLTVGQTYYVRIYSAGTAVGEWASFSLCIKTPPPPATNDECLTAIPVTVNTDAQCVHTAFGNIIGATASTVPNATPACTGNANDDVWFSFVATSTQHFINLLDVEGTNTNLNHAVYTGTCGALTRLYCSDPNSLNSTNDGFVIGQTYYIRVWSNSATSQIVTFNLCVKSISTCETAAPFCGSGPSQSLIFPNTTDTDGAGQIACLGSSPNPTYYYLRVEETGNLTFDIRQSTDPNNFPTTGGTARDVDYVAWGPFDSPQSCSQVDFSDCPSCPNNTTNPNFYPFGNIVDCSYDAAPVETLHIPNAVAGQYYLLLITNFNGDAGYIKLFQSNFGQAGTGATTNLCCDVDAGPDVVACGTSYMLNAIEDSESTPSSYQWYFNNTIIPNATNALYEATQAGVYKVIGTCGLNTDTDEIVLQLLPPIQTAPVPDYILCDDASHDGLATFDLSTLTPTVLGTLDPALYTVRYYTSQTDATIGDLANDIDPLQFTTTTPNSQTIYIRVETNALATCFAVVPVNLVVTQLPTADFSYTALEYCSNLATNPVPTATGTAVFGEFSATPAGLAIDQATGEINLANSDAGIYTVKNLIHGVNGCIDVEFTVQVTITDPQSGSFSYGTLPYCTNAGTATPTMDAGSVMGNFTTDDPTLLVVDAATGVVDIAASTPGTYIVHNTIAPSGGCAQVVADATITITLLPSAEFGYPSNAYCKNSGLTPLPAGANGGALGAFSSTPGLTLDPNTGAIDVANSTAGVYDVKNTIAATNGCTEVSFIFQVTITNAPIADFSYAQSPYCSNAGTANPTLGTGATAGLFTTDDPTLLIVDPATGAVNLAASTPGTYIVHNTIAPAGGCIQVAADATITITKLPVVGFTFNASQYCKNDPTNPVAQPNTGSDAGQFSATPAGLSIDANTGEIDLAASNAGTYQIVETIAAANGCAQVVSAAVTVTISAPPVATFNYGSAPAIYCQSGGTASPTFVGGATAGNFTVTPSGLTIDANTGVVTLASSTEGTYTVTNTVNAGVCGTISFDSEITVTAEITGTLAYPGTPFCMSATGTVTPMNSAPINGVYTATPSGLAIDANGVITPSASNAGVYTVKYSLPAPQGCPPFEATADVTIIPLSDLDINYGCESNDYVLRAVPVNNSFDPATATYAWSGPAFTQGDAPNAIIVTAIGTYQVIVTTPDGCTATRDFTPTDVACDIQKGISPNNDGKNDFFDLSALHVKHLTIFNRYGTQVYEAKNYMKEWHGQSAGGMELPDATYFYVIEKQDGKKETGWIYINR